MQVNTTCYICDTENERNFIYELQTVVYTLRASADYRLIYSNGQ